MSLFSTFGIGTRALRAFQTALQTSSHNIANANTPGYSRQRVLFSTTTPDVEGGFMVGRGVDVKTIERLRDKFFEDQWRSETAVSAQAGTLQEAYQVAEASFQEPSANGLSKLLNNFWDGWSEVANNPAAPGPRAALQSAGSSLSAGFQRVRAGLDNQRKQINNEILSIVSHVNEMASQIDELNKEIKQANIQGVAPNDLTDRRDQLVGRLSEIFDMQTVDRERGSIALYVNGIPLVEESGVKVLTSTEKSDALPGIVNMEWKDYPGETISFPPGKMAGLLSARDAVIPGMQSQLDALAKGIIDQVNTLHKRGVGLDGGVQITGAADFTGNLASDKTVTLNGTSVQFFAGDDLTTIVARFNADESSTGVHAAAAGNRLVLTPSSTNPQSVGITSDPDGLMADLGITNDFFKGTGAGDMGLSDVVAADPQKIAASLSGGAGDNSNARALADLKDSLIMSSNTRTFGEYYDGFMADLGARSEAAAHTLNNQQTLLLQLDNMRESVAGVSIDEELANTIKFQRSFEAASRVIRTADNMLQTLLNMVNR